MEKLKVNSLVSSPRPGLCESSKIGSIGFYEGSSDVTSQASSRRRQKCKHISSNKMKGSHRSAGLRNLEVLLCRSQVVLPSSTQHYMQVDTHVRGVGSTLVCSSVCAATQNSQKFVTTTQILPIILRTTEPKIQLQIESCDGKESIFLFLCRWYFLPCSL